MSRRLVRTVLGAVAAAVVAPGLGSVPTAVAAPADRQAIIDHLVDVVFVPGYQRLAAASEQQVADLTALCAAAGDDGALATARASWDELRTAWLLVRAFRFGPVMEGRFESDIEFEIEPGKIDGVLAGPEPVDTDALADRGADVRGIGAIEHVLFGDTPTDARHCEFATSAATLVDAAVDDVLELWVDGDEESAAFADQLRRPGDDSMYDDTAAIFDDVLNHMIFTLVEVGETRLGRASGDITGTPNPALADPGRARRGARDLRDLLDSVQSVYWGQAPRADADTVWEDDTPESSTLLRDAIADISPDAAARVDEQLGAAAVALDALPDPLAEATDPAPAHGAYVVVGDLVVTLRTEVASVLGVTLTFGDADGDS